jgi:hypothetical protein
MPFFVSHYVNSMGRGVCQVKDMVDVGEGFHVSVQRVAGIHKAQCCVLEIQA